jgi:hypothetical protein
MVAEALRGEIATQSGAVEAAKERLAGHCAGVVLQVGSMLSAAHSSRRNSYAHLMVFRVYVFSTKCFHFVVLHFFRNYSYLRHIITELEKI